MALPERLDADALLDGLDPEQREVATTLRGPVCVIAGAGTGKTRAITHRIAYGTATGVYKPMEVLAVTFTVKAAGEMRERLRTLGAHGVQARTFHSAALRQARYFWPRVYGTDFPQILESKFAFVAEAARQVGVRADQATLRDLAAEVEWAKVSNVRPDDYGAEAVRRQRTVGDIDPGEVGAILRSYEQVKRDRGRIDMEDILLITAAILADEPAIAAEVRRQYKWFVVDEFQDVNPLQSTLLDLWLGGRDEVCVVGDPRQTIYTFAGASATILGDFTTRRFPDAPRIELVRNYRSSPQIVAAANEVFAGRGPSVTLGVRLQSQNSPGPAVDYRPFADEPAEADAIADRIVALHRQGVPYREMAVLYRINAQSEVYEEALGRLQIPYSMRGGTGFFQRPEVRQAVTLLRGSARAGEGSGSLADDVRAVLAAMDFSETPPEGRGAVRDRWESLMAIHTMAIDLAQEQPEADLAALVADLDRRADQAHAPSTDGVTMSTFHAAKGLEWDAVFVAGAQEGTLPYVATMDDPAAVEEERRLFYVGITRARRHLMVSWSAARKAGGQARRKPSRFLDRLLPESVQVSRAPKRKVRLPQPDLDYDEALFERLRAWRKEVSQEESKPAFTVFNDATLKAIAAVRPSSGDQLLQISGVGQSKLEKYGEGVLGIVADA
ncbi:DNA helicase [Aeromicrobium flavum]|uniref:DNA 3'-5' helicase n=1 Tax=Aeromicrobium flavum TaxID=416568 RepID=A0A512HUY4_9ACTN|nr:ATP-dependent helicase [Aeromicrobium flavum]GEO89253.1 DNA helicase [Aeromicrobium flavum]